MPSHSRARASPRLELGFTSIRGLPSDAEERQAAEAAGQGFAPGILAPTVLLVEQESGPLDLEALGRVERALEEQPGVAGVVGPGDAVATEIPGLVVSESAPAGRFLIVLADEPHGGPAIDTLERLREDVPGMLDENGLGTRPQGSRARRRSRPRPCGR